MAGAWVELAQFSWPIVCCRGWGLPFLEQHLHQQKLLVTDQSRAAELLQELELAGKKLAHDQHKKFKVFCVFHVPDGRGP